MVNETRYRIEGRSQKPDGSIRFHKLSLKGRYPSHAKREAEKLAEKHDMLSYEVIRTDEKVI